MGCLVAISHNLNYFSPVERKIANYILSYTETLRDLSSQELAKQLDVSQSGIIKFAQKLGFKGFPDLKLAISEEIGRHQILNKDSALHLHNEITSDDSLLVIAEKLLLEKQSALRETMNALKPEIFHQVAQKMCKAKRIQIAGLGGSALIAKDLTYKLLKIGMPVVSEIDSHVQLTIAQTLKPGDVLLAISYTGQKREILLAAEVAKQNGAILVAITSLGNNKLSAIADYVLHSVADEVKWRSSSISSRSAQNAITDLLFISLVQAEKEQASQLIQKGRNLVNTLNS